MALERRERVSSSGDSKTPVGEGKRCGVYLGKEDEADGALLGAMLVQKSEDVIGPDGGSKIAKRMVL